VFKLQSYLEYYELQFTIINLALLIMYLYLLKFIMYPLQFKTIILVIYPLTVLFSGFIMVNVILLWAFYT